MRVRCLGIHHVTHVPHKGRNKNGCVASPVSYVGEVHSRRSIPVRFGLKSKTSVVYAEESSMSVFSPFI